MYESIILEFCDSLLVVPEIFSLLLLLLWLSSSSSSVVSEEICKRNFTQTMNTECELRNSHKESGKISETRETKVRDWDTERVRERYNI